MAHYSQIQPHSFISQSERPSSLQPLFNSKHSESFPNFLPKNIASNLAKWSTARFFHNHYCSGLPEGRSSHSAIPKFLIQDKSPSAWAVNYSWIYYVILVILFWFSFSGGSTSEIEFQRFPHSTSNVQTSTIFQHFCRRANSLMKIPSLCYIFVYLQCFNLVTNIWLNLVPTL